MVGLVRDAKYNDLQQPAPPTIYPDLLQQGFTASQLAIRTRTDPDGVAGMVRQTEAAVLKTVPIVRMVTMNDQIDSSIVPERLIAALSTGFGALAALLAAIGLYGLLAYTVARRTHEIGVRIALGAAGTDVMRIVLRDGRCVRPGSFLTFVFQEGLGFRGPFFFVTSRSCLDTMTYLEFAHGSDSGSGHTKQTLG